MCVWSTFSASGKIFENAAAQNGNWRSAGARSRGGLTISCGVWSPFRAKRGQNFFYENSKPKQRSKSVDSLFVSYYGVHFFGFGQILRKSRSPNPGPELGRRLEQRLALLFLAGGAGHQNGNKGRPAPMERLALLFLVEEGRGAPRQPRAPTSPREAGETRSE